MEMSTELPKDKKKWRKRIYFKSVKSMLIAGFTGIILMVLGLSFFNLTAMNSMKDRVTYIVENEQPLLVADFQLANDMAQRTSYLQSYVYSGDESFATSFNKGKDQDMRLEEYISKHSDSSWVSDVMAQKAEWGTLTDNLLDLMEKNDTIAAEQLLREKIQPLSDELMDSLTYLANEKSEKTKASGKTVLDLNKRNNLFSFSISIAIVIGLFVLAFLIIKSIMKHIKPINERLHVIADGDFSQEPLETHLTDELGQMVVSANDMNDSLRGMMMSIANLAEMTSSHSEELTQAANEVKSGSEQIATTMQEIASGSETQAESASELATLMISFADKVYTANDAGVKTNQSTGSVLEMANKGQQLMDRSSNQMTKIDGIVHDSVEKMMHLNQQTTEISKLVTVIKDVAEQTNLLALNAAIEAARAGEQGKGFAVVADEVRKLAEQTAQSVTDITNFVQAIQKESSAVAESLTEGYVEVQTGTKQIHETNTTFSQINHAVEKMAGNIEHITENLSDIAKSSQEMNVSIDEIASVSEESAASVEETSASSQQITGSMEEVAGSAAQLAQIAENLNALVQNIQM